MESKKNSSKNVHLYSKHFFLIGPCISRVILISAFEIRARQKKVNIP